MKIQIRQSLYNSIVFGVVFIALSFLIYILYQKEAKKEIYSDLQKNAQIVAMFHLEEDELNVHEFEKVRKQFEDIVLSSSYQVYNDSNTVAFGNRDSIVSISILRKINEEEQLDFSTPNYFCHGISYDDNQGHFIIITREAKTALNDQLFSLLWILLSAFIIGQIAVILLSRWLSRIAYKPFSDIIKQVNHFSLDEAEMQIASPKTEDELQELTDTFNNLLSRISNTFVIQKKFVNYVSHEFRTPLASMLGNLEVFSLKDRTPKEYEELSRKLILQVSQLEEILHTLMVISDLRKDIGINCQFRIDELIWEIIEKIKVLYSNPKVNVVIDISSEDENLLSVAKNRTQLLMALYNIIENAIKYSQGKPVNIRLYNDGGNLCLSIEDHGIGIPGKELDNVTKPFYRADNTDWIQGSGIGLSIALRIFEKNEIDYEMKSAVNEGTTIIVYFR